MPALTHLDTHANFSNIESLDHYSDSERFSRLTNLSIRHGHGKLDEILRYLEINPQLKYLESVGGLVWLKDFQFGSGILNGLKSLVLISKYEREGIELPDVITFEELESLEITSNIQHIMNLLEAFAKGSRMVNRWNVSNDYYGFGIIPEGDFEFNRLITTIGSFEKLTSLSLSSIDFPINSLQILVKTVPNLTFLCLKFTFSYQENISSDDILSMFRNCEHLQQLFVSNCKTEPHFDLYFHHEFYEIAQLRGNNKRSKYSDDHIKIVATGEKLVRNGGLRYWIGYEADRNLSGIHFLNLNEKCIENIAKFLPIPDVISLYKTCTRLRKGVAERISSEIFEFNVNDLPTATIIIQTLGNDLKKIKVSLDNPPNYQSLKMRHYNEVQDKKYIKMLNVIKSCSEHLTELTVDNFWGLNWSYISFKNLEKLMLGRVFSTNEYILPKIYCPKINHLEIGACEFSSIIFGPVDLGISLNNIKVLKFRCLCVTLAHSISTQIEKIRDQLEELSVERAWYECNMIVKLVLRFRNLKSLSLIEPGIENENFKYIFERCNKLEKFSLRCNEETEYTSARSDRILQTFKHLKQNCKNLKVIQFVHNHTKLIHGEGWSHVFDYVSNLFPNVELNEVKMKDGNVYKIHNYKVWKVCEKPY